MLYVQNASKRLNYVTNDENETGKVKSSYEIFRILWFAIINVRWPV